MPSPTQPLGKIYTLKMAVNLIILWLKKETQTELDPEIVKGFVNLAILDVAEIISGAGSDDYGKTADISDIASSVVAAGVLATSYNNTTGVIANALPHTLTSADVGKRVVVIETTPTGAVLDTIITEILSITDANNFVVSAKGTANLPGVGNYVYYTIFSVHSSTSIDLSSYKLSNITKITSSTIGEVRKAGDKEFDNLYRFDEKQYGVFWFKHGQYLYLYVGTAVTNAGDLVLWYTSYPQRITGEDDLLDIRDTYAPLYIAKAKNYCLEHLEMAAPEALTNLIDQKTKEVRDNILREKGLIEKKNKKASEL